jgi:hypothetical protein
MITRLGFYSLLAGIFVGVFNGISHFMGSKNLWVDLTISKIIGQDISGNITGFINISAINNALDYLFYAMPFFIFLLALGVILLFISLFVKNH